MAFKASYTGLLHANNELLGIKKTWKYPHLYKSTYVDSGVLYFNPYLRKGASKEDVIDYYTLQKCSHCGQYYKMGPDKYMICEHALTWIAPSVLVPGNPINNPRRLCVYHITQKRILFSANKTITYTEFEIPVICGKCVRFGPKYKLNAAIREATSNRYYRGFWTLNKQKKLINSCTESRLVHLPKPSIEWIQQLGRK